MAVNGPPWNVKLWIYPGADQAASPELWGIQYDISAYIRHIGNDGGQPITYTYGIQNEGIQSDASTMNLTLDNRSGAFSTKNVLATLNGTPMYGVLKRNTPIVMGVTSGKDSFTRTASGMGTSDSGQGYTVSSSWVTNGSQAACGLGSANTTAYAIMNSSGSADYDMLLTVSVDAVATGAPMIVSGVQQYSPTNYIIFRASFETGAVISASIQRVHPTTGAVIGARVALAGTYAANTRYRMRCQRTGSQLRMKLWLEASTEPATWTVTAVDQDILPGDLGMHTWRVVGNTNAGTLTGFADDVEFTAIEFIGTVAKWPVRWDVTGNNCWAPIQCAGVLRRIQQGGPPINSPLTAQLGAYSPTGWWPLEDSSLATTFASAVSSGRPATFTSVTPATDTSLAGSSTAPTLSAGNGAIRAITSLRHSSTGFSVMFFTKIPTIPTPKTTLAVVTCAGLAVQWVISMDATSTTVEALSSSGAILSSANNLFAIDPTGWVAWQLETDIVGANTTWSFVQHQVGLTTYYAQSGSFASTTVSQATGVTIGGSDFNGMSVSQLWIGPNTLPFVNDTFSLVSNGYIGELAGARILRMCTEGNIPFLIEAGATIACGAQPQGNRLDVLRQTANTDSGILYERGTGLGYRPNSARYGQAVLLALSVAAGQIDEPPEPDDDDLIIRNYWRVDRENGSYAISYDTASIVGEGYYPDQITVSPATDDGLVDQATWRRYLGTRGEMRWPRLTVNFGRNPDLLATWRKRSFGPRLTVVTGRSQATGADPDVLMIGYSGRLEPNSWTLAANCVGAKPYDISVLDDPLEMLDADTSTLDVAVTTTVATTIQVTNGGNAGSTWVPTSLFPTNINFLITVDGEIMNVTNVGDIFSTTKQTLTVTRGINGGAKIHAAGALVRLAYPSYVAL